MTNILMYITQIHRALLKDVGTLFTIDENSSDGQLFGLICSDLQMIKPNYEAMIKGGHLKVTEMGVQHVGKFNYQLWVIYQKIYIPKNIAVLINLFNIIITIMFIRLLHI